MNFLRVLYFNKLVNRLNKNLKIGQKSYLAFFLVSLMILLFSLYTLYSYSELKKRDILMQNIYTMNHDNLSLIVLLEQQYSFLGNHSIERIKSNNEKISEIIKRLNNTIHVVQNEISSSELNLKKLENSINQIESLSIFDPAIMNQVSSLDENQLNSLSLKLRDEISELQLANEKFNQYSSGIKAETDSLYTHKNILILIFLGTGILGSIIIANFISYRITDPIEKLKDNIKILEQGDYNLDDKFEVLDNDEIGDIANGIERIGHTIKETVNFTEKIGENEFDTELNLNKSGKLATSLLSMRDKLKAITEQNEIQKQQEEKRNWVIKGLADLGNILRSNFNDIDTMYFDILKTIINYIGATQGGLFIIHEKDNKQILELSACYAYDRRKYLSKEIEIGEGLVGQCALEKQITNLTEIPNNYLQIASGLGGSNPKNLILVPLILNKEIYGVMEIASFKIFDTHQIEYLEQSAESIASTVSSMQINITTKALLEKTQIQAEEIASSEEEMKQNMEELQATQEESQRKIEQLEMLLEEARMSQIKD